jgi:hypothetical protein
VSLPVRVQLLGFLKRAKQVDCRYTRSAKLTVLQMIDCLNWALRRLWEGCLYLMEIFQAEWMGEYRLVMELGQGGMELG